MTSDWLCLAYLDMRQMSYNTSVSITPSVVTTQTSYHIILSKCEGEVRWR